MAEAKKKKDPFKTRKTKSPAPKEAEAVSPPKEIAIAIDLFRDFQDQAKHFEAEATVQKNSVVDWGQHEYARRSLRGMPGSFKILGNETMVTFIVQDSSAGITEEDLHDFTERWGRKAAEDLVTRDFRSIRFEPSILATHYDEVVNALQVLPDDVLENLFKPMLMTATSGVLENSKKYAKNPEELRELLSMLKVKEYIR